MWIREIQGLLQKHRMTRLRRCGYWTSQIRFSHALQRSTRTSAKRIQDMQSETAKTYSKQGRHDIRAKIGKDVYGHGRGDGREHGNNEPRRHQRQLTKNNLRRGYYSLAEPDIETQPSSGGRTGHGCSDVDTSCAGTKRVVIKEYNVEGVSARTIIYTRYASRQNEMDL